MSWTVDDAALWVDPARRGGLVCLTGTRNDTEWVADYVWNGDYDELRHGWPHITERQIMVACWWEGTQGSRKWRKRWGVWAEEAMTPLWRSDDDLPPLPPTKAAEAR